MDKLHEQFKKPDSIYRPAPFWIWNEEMDSKETIRQLKTMKEHGFGGGFAHVRLGLISEYLGEEFFRCWEETLEYCKKNDIKLYMYDENGWPSGFAGGKVMQQAPETWPNWVKYEIVGIDQIEKIKNIVRIYEYDEETKTVGRDFTGVSFDNLKKYGKNVSEKYMVLRREIKSGEPWCGHFPYVDLSNPKVTEVFLESTYDEYYRRTGKDFGSVVPAVFSDEANVAGVGEDRFLYSDVISKKFYEMHGYRLEDNMPAIYEDFNGDFDADPVKVRYDFNTTISTLWIDSFIKPIASWCEKHNVAWTGHDQEHSWPLTKGGAFSEQRTYEFRQWPGMDWLLCDALREDDAWNDTLLMHEIRSAANQFNKERTLVEAYGAAGWHSTFKDYKRIGDWLLVNGLNFFAHHLTHYSIIGSRKRDCPQSFDWREPWWDEYAEYNDYLSRACYLLSQGKMEQRILYFNTTTTGYLVPASEQDGQINHTKGVDVIKNPDMSDFLECMQRMQDEQWDYDLGDEFSVADNVSYNGKKIGVGVAEYDVVVISDSMKNFRRETVEILKQFAANGGKIIATGNAAEYIDGVKCPEELSELRKSWTIVDGSKGLLCELDKTLQKRITSDKAWVRGVNHMRRVLEDGREVYFFVNTSMKDYESKITVPGKSAVKWDLFTGEKQGIPCEAKDGRITFDLKLEWTQSAMIIVNDEADIVEAKKPATKQVKIETASIIPEKDNNIILDHLKLKIDDTVTPEIYMVEANRNMFGARGYGYDPWLQGIQLGDEYIKQKYDEGTGFEACYNVYVKPGCVPTHVRVLVERPTLLNLRVNGTEVKWTGEGCYLDYKMGTIDISGLLREGNNELVLWTTKFDIRIELDALILEGDFGVSIENDRFVIDAKPEMLTYGSWMEQKWRFYPNAVLYKYGCRLENAPESAKLVLGKYEASAISATVNGKYAGIVGKDGDDYVDLSGLLDAGDNEIVLRVCGSFRNLFGPYINYNDQTVATWGDFEQFTKGEVNKASEYSMIDYGLFEEPRLYINE